jgi:two-component system OmpR family response regulator
MESILIKHDVESAYVGHAARIYFHGFELDSITRRAQYRGNPLPLTATEFELLWALLESSGVALSREQLSDRLLLQSFHPLGRSLDMLVSRLRRKLTLEDNPGRAIRSVRSMGYIFRLPGDALPQPSISNAEAN